MIEATTLLYRRAVSGVCAVAMTTCGQGRSVAITTLYFAAPEPMVMKKQDWQT